jgi:hypothetical protein
MKDAALLGRPLLLKEGRHFMKKNVILWAKTLLKRKDVPLWRRTSLSKKDVAYAKGHHFKKEDVILWRRTLHYEEWRRFMKMDVTYLFSTCYRVCKRTAWILIRLRGCAGWSGSMLIATHYVGFVVTRRICFWSDYNKGACWAASARI